MIEYVGNWYYLDATWDDFDSKYYNYFMVTDVKIDSKRINVYKDNENGIKYPKSDKPLEEKLRKMITEKHTY